jgi:hypothetical protein
MSELRRRSRTITTGVLAALARALGVYPVAAREASTIASYTGCLKNGEIDSIAVWEARPAPCDSTTMQVRLSSGDVTSVSASMGLSDGGHNGDLTLAVDPPTVHRLAENCLRTDASIKAVHQDGTVICNLWVPRIRFGVYRSSTGGGVRRLKTRGEQRQRFLGASLLWFHARARIAERRFQSGRRVHRHSER